LTAVRIALARSRQDPAASATASRGTALANPGLQEILEMDIRPDLVSTICQQVLCDSARALRAMRLSHRQARLIEPEILSPDQAELHDINQIVWSVVKEALPLCRALGVRLLLQQDPRLPAVPMLVRPIEDTLIAAFDMCLEDEVQLIRVKTAHCRNRAITIVERLGREAEELGRRPGLAAAEWCTIGPGSHVELLVGDRTTRALGGRLRIQRRADDLRFSLELPCFERPEQGHLVGERAAPQPPRGKYRFEFPGIESPAQQTAALA
jgi:hypothetical protein